MSQTGQSDRAQSLTVSLLQLASPASEPKSARLERVRAWLDNLAPADLVVLPELWPTGYFGFDRYREEAESLEGPTMTMCRQLARRRGFYLAAGSLLEHDTQGQIRNTAVLIGPSGELVHRYSKVHLFSHRSREAEILTPGRSLPVTALPFARISLTTCYDLRFAGLWHQIALRGAELVVVPAAWPGARLDHWLTLTKARAIESQIFLLACNSTRAAAGHDGGSGCGHTRVIDPMGRVLGELGTAEEELRLTLDLSDVAKTRGELVVLPDVLTDYSKLDS